jgi:hypothetical protein
VRNITGNTRIIKTEFLGAVIRIQARGRAINPYPDRLFLVRQLVGDRRKDL